MHKVKELEDKWFKYKVKKLLSPMMHFSVFSLLVVGSYYIYETKGKSYMTNVLGVSMDVNNSMDTKVDKKLPIKKPIVSKEETFKEPEIIEKIAFSPIIPVIDMEKEERISETVKRKKPVNTANTVVAKKNNYLTAKELATISKSHKSDEVVPRKTKKMKFTSTSSNYLETIKRKFHKSNNTRDALLLAKSYYKKAEYTKAEKWALTANKLNNSLEDSWLLFAKSKAKLGKKKEALKILVSYYKKSHSVKAKRLIGKIRTGKI